MLYFIRRHIYIKTFFTQTTQSIMLSKGLSLQQLYFKLHFPFTFKNSTYLRSPDVIAKARRDLLINCHLNTRKIPLALTLFGVRSACFECQHPLLTEHNYYGFLFQRNFKKGEVHFRERNSAHSAHH